MKGFFTALTILLLISCKESGVQLAKPSTFVRYFNGGFNDQAETILETSDKGFLILANSLTGTTLSNTFYKIKLIKTDAYGNQVWEQIYPNFPKNNTDSVPSYRGFGLAAIQDNNGNDTGYVITGDHIKDNNHSLLMIQVDKNGSQASTSPKIWYTLNYQGTGVAWSKNSGDFFLVGQIPSSTSGSIPSSKSMIFAQVNHTTLDTVWSKKLGDGSSTLTNRLFLDYSEQGAYWGGTVQYSAASQGRFVNSGFNSQIVGFNLTVGNPFTHNSTGSDLCPYGFGYAIVGSQTVSGSSFYTRILTSRFSSDGSFRDSVSFPVKYPQTAQTGNSICSTQDGGLLVLGTYAVDAQGTDTDYYLIKVDAFGSAKPQWTKTQGSKFVDVGVKVLQASDGGYIVLGNTNLANVQSIFLMKTDLEGNIQ